MYTLTPNPNDGLSFLERADRIHHEIEALKIALMTMTASDEQSRTVAKIASLQRSERWYRARAGTKTDIHAHEAGKGQE